MKRRESFVANSSSSSFIVAYRDINAVVENVEPAWVKSMVVTMLDAITHGGTPFRTLAELDAHIIEQYGGRDMTTIKQVLEYEGEYLGDRYKEMKKAIKKGFVVVDINIDTHDEWSCEFFGNLPYRKFNEPMTTIVSEN
jgi:uncharacterized protein related to proFAR isomerase